MEFVQGNYNIYRDAGGSHETFMMINGLDPEIMQQLKEVYLEGKDDERPDWYLKQVDKCHAVLEREQQTLGELLLTDGVYGVNVGADTLY